ncbi:MAG: hypothetical protein AAGI51_15640 [Pseudomonadota bacterium]
MTDSDDDRDDRRDDGPEDAPEAPRFDPLDGHPALVAPGVYEFHPHRPKLWILAVALGLLCAWLISLVFAPPATGPADPVVLGLAVALVGSAAWSAWRAAADPRPVLRVDAEALEDRVHGRIPWSDIASWSERRSMIAPGFGWTLRKGVRPPENKALYRLQAIPNSIAGLPGRSYRRKLIAGGCDPMAIVFRALHPDLER